MQKLAEMAQHKNTGATSNIITNYSTQLFVEEIVKCDKKNDRYQLVSIKLIKLRLNTKRVRDKWDDLQTRLRKMPGKKYSVIKMEHSFEVLGGL